MGLIRANNTDQPELKRPRKVVKNKSRRINHGTSY